VHNSIKFTFLDIEEYCAGQNCEICAIQIDIADEKLGVLAVYRSPLGNFNMFLTNFEIILQKFVNLNYNFIVCGDFNVDYCTESSKKTHLNKILQSFNLSSIVNFPTRISSNSSSTIDNFFINNTYLPNFDVSPLINGLSDHNGLLLTLQFAWQHTRDQGVYYKRLITRTTIDDFLFKLSHETWASVFEVNDVNTTFSSFLNTFLRHFYSSISVTKVNKRLSRNSWITSGILTSCQRKRALYMELKNNNNPSVKKHFRSYCRILSRVIQEAKKMEFDRHILNSDNVRKTSWILINKECCKDRNKHAIHSLNINGRSTTNQYLIASAFNKHFTNMPTMITRNITASNCSVKTSVNNQNNISLSLHNVFQTSFLSIKYHYTSAKEIEKIIKSLNSSNSCGYDEVPMKLLKVCSHYISSPLTYICNRSLFTGIFPNRLKYASIRPLFKKGNNDEMNNYRPVSLLTSFSKILEKVLQRRLLHHLTEHNILVKEQYGFRTNLKTDNATFHLMHEILKGLNNNMMVGAIFSDL